MVAEALEEHQQAKMLLNELEGLGADEDELKQLGEDLESAKGTAHRKAG
jgi:hypothetical protein